MSFLVKQDYYGIAGASLVCKSSTEGASASVAEAKGSDGSVVAAVVYGRTSAPSCDYALKGSFSAGEGDIALGRVSAVNGKSFVLGNFAVNTGAGAEPTLAASGEQVEDGAQDACVYELPAFDLSPRHHAQILFGAFEFSGVGCHLQQANYTASASVGKGTKDGDCLAHDVIEGKIECSVEFNQTGAAAPVLTPGEGWIISSPLTLTNSDASFGSWSATLVKYLTKKSA